MKFQNVDFDTYFQHYPDKDGYFGKYGGVFVDDKLKAAMAEITQAYYSICQSRKFIAELRRIRTGRSQAQNLPESAGICRNLSESANSKQNLYVCSKSRTCS